MNLHASSARYISSLSLLQREEALQTNNEFNPIITLCTGHCPYLRITTCLSTLLLRLQRKYVYLRCNRLLPLSRHLELS